MHESRQDRFGVAVAPEGVARRLKLAAQLEMVVDLAVEDDRIASVGRLHRLMAASDVDDAEPSHAEAEIAIDHLPAVVGPTMHDLVALLDDGAFGNRPSASPVPPRYAAHWSFVPITGSGRRFHRGTALVGPERAAKGAHIC